MLRFEGTEDPRAGRRPLAEWWPGTWRSALVLLVLGPAAAAPPTAWILATAAAVAAAAALAPWPVRRVSLAGAATAAALLSVLVSLTYQGAHHFIGAWLLFEMAALCLLLWRVVRRAPARQLAWAGPLLGLVVTLLPLRLTLRMPYGWEQSAFAVTLTFVPVLAVAAAAAYLRALEARRKRAVAGARRDLRLEVARALHDFVAHEVTGVVLEVQAAQVTGEAPEQFRELLQRVEEAGLRALDSMDQTVLVLRDPDAAQTGTTPPRLYGLGDLPDLVGRFSGSSGPLRTELELDEDAVGLLAREADTGAYTMVLEALTNVRRHAPRATRIAVRACRAEGGVELSVTNNGGGGGGLLAGRRGGGTGLIELTERIRVLGGTLTAGPYQGGWQVRAYLPAPASRTSQR
ncbi:histidine kinase [Streptomyces sp. ACA25]|uniref:sensor histidine kinase n=1 Tax=Streptomyces sp. ACA25 TaxID=3022596 RepID=UPI002307DB1E|nr:histidine kinase [Streptomyces sp. ACA25]MDB1088336.1 histidine kinase [Streptomyces sp. ACA25]